VAQAAQAAWSAGLGSASVDTSALRRFEAIDRAATSGPLHKARRRERRGLASGLLWQTARAARQIGLRPEEAWAEALGEWLSAQELVPDVAEEQGWRPAMVSIKRQQTWHEIETAMQALRAS
jgi:hypothetical protein